ncbi:GNAT family N-acetyltransferase [Agrobacterium vitis]|uniref:GNAT family N-acetyltransferase n=1 Tax=Agrobacterium vitis TaxID=373 RepID=A0ABD6G4K3_AGRVI|nr:GNAT family N-acetyltransferase [Agrobacterium vitis]MUO78402.1 GNAT family N-acetyltransferase [Agrobacterium vitis]MUO94279.1 GNAT family N-acetyltransferase [Agrobacterium vitis]MUP03267.1 GNAT family N-acetyltransferase [Agrobacterium vitis]MUZ84381.1 GNAT family N-acetyltransferase [Agrobacterium vitis]MVA10394.1 GNAT family N-acetyltransferase [Agrobacterium vitis]
MENHIRLAEQQDADAIASVFTRSRSLLGFLPKLHTAEEDRHFIETVVLAENSVRVAIENHRICGFIAVKDGWIDHLYIDPDHLGKGMGSRLLTNTMADATHLKLWTFQQNQHARRFYEYHGFTPDLMTDGDENEEKQPDVLYVWSRTTS